MRIISTPETPLFSTPSLSIYIYSIYLSVNQSVYLSLSIWTSHNRFIFSQLLLSTISQSVSLSVCLCLCLSLSLYLSLSQTFITQQTKKCSLITNISQFHNRIIESKELSRLLLAIPANPIASSNVLYSIFFFFSFLFFSCLTFFLFNGVQLWKGFKSSKAPELDKLNLRAR